MSSMEGCSDCEIGDGSKGLVVIIELAESGGGSEEKKDVAVGNGLVYDCEDAVSGG